MSKSMKQVLFGALFFALAACEGEGSAAGGGEEGEEPLARVNVALSDAIPSSVTSPYLVVAWSTYQLWDDEAPTIPTEAVPLAHGIEEVELSLFQGPPASVLTEVDGVTMAISGIGAFDDRDGDGKLTIGEEGIVGPDVVFGFSPKDFLIYVELAPGAELPPGLFINPEAFVPGLSRARLVGCLGPLEFIPMDAPVVLEVFDPEEGFVPPEDECDDLWEECLNYCKWQEEELYEWCMKEHGEETCEGAAIDLDCEDYCQEFE